MRTLSISDCVRLNFHNRPASCKHTPVFKNLVKTEHTITSKRKLSIITLDGHLLAQRRQCITHDTFTVYSSEFYYLS